MTLHWIKFLFDTIRCGFIWLAVFWCCWPSVVAIRFSPAVAFRPLRLLKNRNISLDNSMRRSCYLCSFVLFVAHVRLHDFRRRFKFFFFWVSIAYILFFFVAIKPQQLIAHTRTEHWEHKRMPTKPNCVKKNEKKTCRRKISNELNDLLSRSSSGSKEIFN